MVSNNCGSGTQHCDMYVMECKENKKLIKEMFENFPKLFQNHTSVGQTKDRKLG